MGPAAIRAATSQPAGGVTDLSKLVHAIRGNDRVPGLWGAVVDTNGLLAAGADGIRKARATVAVTADDHVHLGSCTKAMTATLIAQLVEAGKLAWDRPLSACFTDLAAKANADTAAATIRHVLDHRAGLPRNVDWPKFNALPGDLIVRRRAVVEHLLSEPPRHAPGSTYEYSNAGYVLLGAIVESVHGKRWEEVVIRDLFQPLNMVGAGFGPPGASPPGVQPTTDEPWGHRQTLGIRLSSQDDNPAVMTPAGRVNCRLDDWAKYIAWTLRADSADTPILKHATQAALLTPPAGTYAAGWEITSRPWAGGRTLVHSGDNTFWHCVAWLAPLKGFAVLAATNISDDVAPKVCDELAGALIDWHHDHT